MAKGFRGHSKQHSIDAKKGWKNHCIKLLKSGKLKGRKVTKTTKRVVHRKVNPHATALRHARHAMCHEMVRTHKKEFKKDCGCRKRRRVSRVVKSTPFQLWTPRGAKPIGKRSEYAKFAQ